MSRYTTEVRYICESEAGKQASEGFNTIEAVIEASREKIFNFDFPIFDEDYRPVLETKILRHYYTREICEETYGLWKLRLADRLNVIMPYYNKLYKSELLEFNPLYDVNYTRDYERKGKNDEEMNRGEKEETTDNEKTNQTNTMDHTMEITENGKQNTTGKETMHDNISGEDWDLYSDTPQGGIEIFGLDDSVEDNSYLTNARRKTNKQTDDRTTDNTGTFTNDNTRNTTSNLNGETHTGKENIGNRQTTENRQINLNTTDNYLEHVRGKQAGKSYSALLMEYRASFIRIDNMILEELSDLFFGLWF